MALAKRYELLFTVNRDSSTEQLAKAYRKLLLKAHPDKGGRKVDFQKLQQAKETWDAVRKGPVNQGGRPTTGADAGVLACQRRCKEYRVCATLVLLTYNGFADKKQWKRFVVFVRGSLKKWGVKRWGATLEACETEGLHTHLVLQLPRRWTEQPEASPLKV